MSEKDIAGRSATVYKAESDKIPDAVKQDDEELYEMSAGRAKIYQTMLTKKSRKLTEGGPMISRETRLALEAEKAQQHQAERQKKGIEVRIRFPDQTQLLGKFTGQETVGDVMTFVRFSLVDPMLPFYLFITPPRRELRDESKKLIADLKFAAREIVYFAWDLKCIERDFGKDYVVPNPALRPEVLKEAQDIANLELKAAEEQAKQEEKDEIERKQKGKTSGHLLGSSSKLTKPPAWMRLAKK
ncbi:uncharacterized protein V1516DRAFT_671585 [Lipomyces oligophaga]|uniref:uncharacterized protein n=1 Tax=Lipomyces oligophaga TaxID=45792 RepID=UPI0034CF0904